MAAVVLGQAAPVKLTLVARLKTGGANPFVDPTGYRAAVADAEAAYLKQLAAERAKR